MIQWNAPACLYESEHTFGLLAERTILDIIIFKYQNKACHYYGPFFQAFWIIHFANFREVHVKKGRKTYWSHVLSLTSTCSITIHPVIKQLVPLVFIALLSKFLLQ